MTHRCDPALVSGGNGEAGPVTLSRCLRLFLAYLDDELNGNANQVIEEIGDCTPCWFAVAMGSVGTAVSLFREVSALRGDDPRPSLELHLAAALDRLAAEEAGGAA